MLSYGTLEMGSSYISYFSNSWYQIVHFLGGERFLFEICDLHKFFQIIKKFQTFFSIVRFLKCLNRVDSSYKNRSWITYAFLHFTVMIFLIRFQSTVSFFFTCVFIYLILVGIIVSNQDYFISLCPIKVALLYLSQHGFYPSRHNCYILLPMLHV